MKSTIVYTQTDEAPALATASLLPIFKAFALTAGVKIESRDISLAGRVLAAFSDYLSKDQIVSDALKELSEIIKEPSANVIKLPNISASGPQLKGVIKELQEKGFNLPDYPDEPKSNKDAEIKARYDGIKGSAVNPVLREGNSDRRAPGAVKQYAKKNPHTMGKWRQDSKSSVGSMSSGDFYESEKSITLDCVKTVNIILEAKDGSRTILKEGLNLFENEIIDAAVLSCSKLRAFIREQIEIAKSRDVLFSVHLKATMMKVSDPIIFGHFVSVYFSSLFKKYKDSFQSIGVNPNNGLGDLFDRIKDLDTITQDQIKTDFNQILESGPDLAMVDSDLGITNLHVPSDVIIDASMPAMIRSSGQMWDKKGVLRDVLAIIPDRSYAGIYQATIDFCKKNGAFDPATMGSVSNVGLMAQKAEEYGSHDKTFEIQKSGHVIIIDRKGKILLDQAVECGDIFRMCQVKDSPIRNWVQLAVERAKITQTPAIFWLDKKRGHDRQLIKKVTRYLADYDTSNLDIQILSPIEATQLSLERIQAGKDTISVTGNVLRDYLTDLFPIMELGTSAKMLSIVPLMNGGGLFETGAGGSAPKHVQQFLKEGHLRWDSLGEFLAFSASLEYLAQKFDNLKAKVLADALDNAVGKILDNGKSPQRKVHQPDNRSSHFYLALYWAEALTEQQESMDLQKLFQPIFKEFQESEEKILADFEKVQGHNVYLGGYYLPDQEKLRMAMRPSALFNSILERI